MAYSKFSFVKSPTGTLSGESFVQQAEDAINGLGQQVYEVVENNANLSAQVQQAISTANSAQNTASTALNNSQNALSQLDTLTVTVNTYDQKITQAVSQSTSAVQTATAAQESAQAAQESAQAAQTAAESASSQAQQAQESATTAQTQAEAAQTAAEAAQDQATDASNSAQQAQQQAQQAQQNAESAANSAASLAQDAVMVTEQNFSENQQTQARTNIGALGETEKAASATTADRFSANRTISLTGAVTGSVSSNFSGGVSIATTYTVMDGATASAAGAVGAVPAPAAGENDEFLRGDGTWQPVPNNMVLQTASSSNGNYPILLKETTGTSTTTDGSIFDANVYVNPSTGVLTANGFVGNLTGNASTASEWATARTITLSGDGTWSVSFNGSANASGEFTLAASGATAGSYGESAAKTLSYGGSFSIPYVTVDAKGRVTNVKSIALKMPSAQTNVTGNAETATKLETARKINGVAFDGSKDISIDLLASAGRVTALEGTTQGAQSGLQMYEAYNNGYPENYGNVLHLKAKEGTNHGECELFLGWSGTTGAHAPIYVRNRRDTTSSAWSDWKKVYTEGDSVPGVNAAGNQNTTGNAATATKLKTARSLKVNLATTAADSFDGSGNADAIGVSGTLPTGNGGTGRTDGKSVGWATARTITLSGDATGSVSIDGSANATLNLTIANGSVTNAMLASSSVTFSKVARGDVATQAEAEAGTANNSFMTPLRVAQAIAAQGGAGEAYITKTYNDGSGNWYRKWSDGFIEQGGIVSVPNVLVVISLNTAFTTNTYSLSAFVDNNLTSASAYQFAVTVESITTTSFTVSKYNPSTLTCHWFACGY